MSPFLDTDFFLRSFQRGLLKVCVSENQPHRTQNVYPGASFKFHVYIKVSAILFKIFREILAKKYSRSYLPYVRTKTHCPTPQYVSGDVVACSAFLECVCVYDIINSGRFSVGPSKGGNVNEVSIATRFNIIITVQWVLTNSREPRLLRLSPSVCTRHFVKISRWPAAHRRRNPFLGNQILKKLYQLYQFSKNSNTMT